MTGGSFIVLRKLSLLVMIACSVLAADKKAGPAPKLKTFKPGFNFFSVEQDVQMGKEAAAQVEKQFEVINNPELNAFVQGVANKIIAQPQAGKFPYTFKVVGDTSINAFALPGGAMFIHTGLITAADSEAQLAAVMAHEITHVALRHGTHQASKANLIQIPAALAGGMLGGGLLGSLEQAGIGLLANGALLKFSRDAETQADLMGAQMMAQAGYNPIEMARFFEKLEAETGKGNWVSSMMSDHPNPGNRVKNVENEIMAMPQKNYTADTGGFLRAKAIVKALPPPKKRVSAGQPGQPPPSTGTVQMPSLNELRPSNNYKTAQNGAFSISYPDNWQTQADQSGGSLTIAPAKGSIGQGQQMALAYGSQFNFTPFQNGQQMTIQQATQSLVQNLQQGDSNMKIAQNSQQTQVDGYQGMMTMLTTGSPYQGQQESDMLLTVALPQGIFWAVFVAPSNDMSNVQPAFQRMIQSIKFARN